MVYGNRVDRDTRFSQGRDHLRPECIGANPSDHRDTGAGTRRCKRLVSTLPTKVGAKVTGYQVFARRREPCGPRDHVHVARTHNDDRSANQ